MKQLLKFITCGSVDDGKSTLIGHILYDSKLLYADQKKALELDSKVGSRGGNIDYSLLLDGLTEEREQGITIDVAYRYFTTKERSFIVADTPGHEQYTRNMAVGASFADLAILLLDAAKGVLVQTRRHARICSLMGIEHFVFAINKMDLVDYSRDVYEEIKTDIGKLAEDICISDYITIPVCATEGDNVTKKSEKLDWYDGPTLLSYLENKEIDSRNREEGFYLPVQRVCRPDCDFRGFQGQIEAGEVSVGDEVVCLPEGEKARVKGILRTDRELSSAGAGDPVTITLDREIDVSRGNVIAKGIQVSAVNQIKANILWMDSKELREGSNLYIKVGTAQIPCTVSEILYKCDVNTGDRIPAVTLAKNEIAECRIRLADRIVADLFEEHRTLGEFILIDRVSFMTCACGVIKGTEHTDGIKGSALELRNSLLSQKGLSVEFVQSDVFTKEKLSRVEKKLIMSGSYVYFYDAASLSSRKEDIRIINEVVKHLTDAGIITLILVDEEQRKKISIKGSYFRYSGRGPEDDDRTIMAFVKKISSKETNLSVHADYI